MTIVLLTHWRTNWISLGEDTNLVIKVWYVIAIYGEMAESQAHDN